MATKKISDATTSIKKGVEENKAIIGLKEVTAAVRAGEVSSVYVASNCPPIMYQRLVELCNIQSVTLIQVPQPNDELGVICKKPYAITALALKNE